jgi:hypothetical protein
MPSADHYWERYHAHKKWKKYQGLITALSMFTLIGWLWAWITGIRWYQHHRAAKKAKKKAEEIEAEATG